MNHTPLAQTISNDGASCVTCECGQDITGQNAYQAMRAFQRHARMEALSVGDFASTGLGADHYAVEVIERTDKTITVRHARTIHSGETFVVSSNPDGLVQKFTRRRDASYRQVGTTYCYLSCDVDDYRDPSF